MILIPFHACVGVPSGIRLRARPNVGVAVGGKGVAVFVGKGVMLAVLLGMGVEVGSGVAVGGGSSAEHAASNRLKSTNNAKPVFFILTFQPFLYPRPHAF